MGRPKGSRNKPKDQTMPKASTAERTETVADQATSKGEVAVFQPPRLPYHPAVEERFGVDKGQWKVLVEAIYPAARTADAIVMVLTYCKSRNLDPFKRPVHIVPVYDSARGAYIESVWPGISELRTTASRTKGYAGCDEAEFGPNKTMEFKGRVKIRGEWKDEAIKLTFPEWCRITVYRVVDGARCKFVGPKVAWLETYATQGNSELPNKMWQERTEGQLEKCAEAAALRRAFPEELGNELTAEEMIGRDVHDLQVVSHDSPAIADHSERDQAPPRQAPKQEQEEARDGTPPPRQPKAEPPRDAAPPRQAKADPISSGPPKRDTGPSEKPVAPHQISGEGHSYESWCEKYIDLIKTSEDTATVYKWIDANRVPLERLNKGKPSVYAKAKTAVERLMEQLREANKKAEEKAAKKKDAPAPSDMAEPSEMADDAASLPDYGKPGDDNPETVLKWIDGVLATAEDPADVEQLWTNVCQQYTLDFIPPDQDEAQALIRKHEKRLEP